MTTKKICLKDAVRMAVLDGDLNAAAAVTDLLQFRFGMNYQDIYTFVNNIVPITKARWDRLLYDADRIRP